MSKVIFESEKRITQGYSWNGSTGHGGVDLGWRGGSADDVYANCSGVVTYVQTGYGRVNSPNGMASYGNMVEVTHDNGYKTLYAHLNDVYVSVGDKVNSKTKIGTEGSTGYVTAKHLHYEVRNKYNERIDPTPYLTARVGDLESTTGFNTKDKSIDELARDVIKGLYGNGNDRVVALGDKYDEVQSRVNEILRYETNKVYTVKYGDTLSGIASKFNMNWHKLYEDNKNVIGDNPNLIYPGQKLVIK